MSNAEPECSEYGVIRGRSITLADIQAVQRLVTEVGNTGRWAVAQALCERWQWRARNGQLKIRSALAILTELARQGRIQLPAAQSKGHAPGGPWRIASGATNGRAILAGSLSDYRPLRWELVENAVQRKTWRTLMAEHHYLGAPLLVGASLRYLVYGRAGELLGALGWQSAVHHLGCRDRLLGWNPAQRARGLERVVNGVRFLVLPWVQVPNLASVMLSENLALLQRDWRARYGVRPWLAETFVDRQRFFGTAYRAANWVPIGWTRGFAKRHGAFVHHGQTKEVYVYVLNPRLLRQIHDDPDQPLLTCASLLARPCEETAQPLTRRTRMKNNPDLWQPKLPPSYELNADDVRSVGSELKDFCAQFHRTFPRVETRELCELYCQGLVSGVERKNCEAIALALEDPQTVRNLQRFMTEYQWDEPWMRQKHWELSAEQLSDEQGVWSIDASEMAKKGNASVGVAKQYCGSLGKVANCQSGVFVCYASPKGHLLLDAQLYLPQAWFTEAYAERRQRCRLPEEIAFQTKPQLAGELFAKVYATKLFKGRWITMDCSFGNHEEFLASLPQGLYHLAEIACTRQVWLAKLPPHSTWPKGSCTVESLVSVPGLLHWETHKIAEGEKGPIVAAFARVRVCLDEQRTPESERWLVLRNDANGKIKYALSNAPADLPMREHVRVSGARWPIERGFEENKSELGLDHYEHRSWPAWHRHMRLVFLAQLFLLRLRHKFKKNARPDAAPGPPIDRMVLAQSET